MPYPTTLLPTTVVGSYPQPDWLVNQDVLRTGLVPRVHAHEIWRVMDGGREAAQDKATLEAIRAMEAAGIDIITDGEIRRESYSNHFALSLDGIDGDNPAEVTGRTGAATRVPRVVGKIRRTHPSRYGMPRSYAPTRRTRPRSPCLARSPWRNRRRMSGTATRKRWRWIYAIAVNEELLRHQGNRRRCDPIGRTLDAGPARTGDRATACKVLNRALQGDRGRHGRASLLRLRACGERQTLRLLVPAGQLGPSP